VHDLGVFLHAPVLEHRWVHDFGLFLHVPVLSNIVKIRILKYFNKQPFAAYRL